MLLLVGVAAADALRGSGLIRAGPETPAVPAPKKRSEPARFPPVRAEGSLVFTDAEDCRIREVVLSGGTEFPLPRLTGSCDLWVPPFGARIAYAVGPAFRDAMLFHLFDLNHPDEDLGGGYALDGSLTWSLDGQRVAWCGLSRKGIDFEFYGKVRRLDECPSAYTHGGEVAYVHGDRVVAGRRTVLRASAPVSHVAFGYDGSIAVVAGDRLERYDGGELRHARELPPAFARARPTLSPDNCAALFPHEQTIVLLDVGCFRGDDQMYEGTDADWSPDGEWVVVAERDAIAFHHVVGKREEVRWATVAADLGWRTRVPPRTHFSHR